MPNRSEDERYFIAPSDPILFSFGQKGPSFDWFYVGSGDRRMVVSMHSSYEAFVYPEASQEQLEQLDKILSSMALK